MLHNSILQSCVLDFLLQILDPLLLANHLQLSLSTNFPLCVRWPEQVEMRIYWAFFYLGVSRNGDSELSDGFDNLLLAIGFILFKSKYEASPIPTFSYKLDTSGAIEIGKNLITLFHRPVIVSLYDPISLTFSKIGGSQRQGKISCFIDFDQISKRDSPAILLSL